MCVHGVVSCLCLVSPTGGALHTMSFPTKAHDRHTYIYLLLCVAYCPFQRKADATPISTFYLTYYRSADAEQKAKRRRIWIALQIVGWYISISTFKYTFTYNIMDSSV